MSPRRHRFSAAPKRAKGKTKTEQRFEETYLRPRQLAGEVIDWGFEPARIPYASGGNYTPDYAVLLSDGTVELWEVKGSGGWLEEGSKPRWKSAAESWFGGLFVFRSAVERRKKDGGGWKVSTYERRTDWPTQRPQTADNGVVPPVSGASGGAS